MTMIQGLCSNATNSLPRYSQTAVTNGILNQISNSLTRLTTSAFDYYQSTMQDRSAKTQLDKLVSHKQQNLLAAALHTMPSFKSSDTSAILKILILTKALSHKPLFKTTSEAKTWLGDITQTHFLRPKHVEREDLKTSKILEHNRLGLIKSLREIQQYDACVPKLKTYDQLWVLGADEKNMSKRFFAAAQDLNQNQVWIKDETICVRTGERPLLPFIRYKNNTDENRELKTGEPATLELLLKYNLLPRHWILQVFQKHLTPEVLAAHNSDAIQHARAAIKSEIESKYPNVHWPTEADLARDIFEKAKLQFDHLNQFNLKIVCARMNADGSRPTTEDVEKKAQLPYSQHHTPKVLVYSNQPHIMRQALVLRNAQPHVEFDACGSGESQNFNIAVSLDELARRIYQSVENSKSLNQSNEKL